MTLTAATGALPRVLQRFPPVAYAFAYGSGAFHQPGLYEVTGADERGPGTQALREPHKEAPTHVTPHARAAGKGTRPMVDFIFAVNDAHAWHAENLKRNPDDYSWVGRLGDKVVVGIAEAIGIGIHFNTLVQVDYDTTIKYGVVPTWALQQDLEAWSHLYLAGRMHKPVKDVLPQPPAIAAAAKTNHQHALAAALLLLPPTFTGQDLVHRIAGLSYQGDIRMALRAEDPHKVERIAAGSNSELLDMYMPLLKDPRYAPLELQPVAGSDGQYWQQAKHPDARSGAVGLLAPGLLHKMASKVGFSVPPQHLAHGADATKRDVVAAIMRTGQPERLAQDSMAAMVRSASVHQAAAGLLAAGGGKSVQYVAGKVGKALRPMYRQVQMQLGRIPKSSDER